jgi:hypothetical protein
VAQLLAMERKPAKSPRSARAWTADEWAEVLSGAAKVLSAAARLLMAAVAFMTACAVMIHSIGL